MSVLPREPLVWHLNWVSCKTFFISLDRMKEQGDFTDKEQSVRLQTLPRCLPPTSLPPTTLPFISEFLISSLGVPPVLWESLADSSASDRQNLCLFGSEVLPHMESLILLQLIGKTAIGMYPCTLVTDDLVFGGWHCSPEYNLLWSLPRSLSDPAVLYCIIFNSHPSPSDFFKFTFSAFRFTCIRVGPQHLF